MLRRRPRRTHLNRRPCPSAAGPRRGHATVALKTSVASMTKMVVTKKSSNSVCMVPLRRSAS